MAEYVLPTRTHFETSDPDVAVDAVRRLYPWNSLSRFDRRQVSFKIDTVTAGPLRVDHTELGLPGRAIISPADYLILVSPIAGTADITHADGVVRVGPRQSALCLAGIEADIEWTGHFDHVVIPIPLAPVAHQAAAAFDIAPDEVRFEAMMPVTPTMDEYWRTTVEYIVTEIRAPDSALGHPLVQARAMEFIAANADLPITVDEIAQAAGVGVRSLQKSFVEHLAVTPMGYVRQVRLNRAHLELQAAVPGEAVTVKAIAAKWGFARADRFGSVYQKTYHVTPGHTLRN